MSIASRNCDAIGRPEEVNGAPHTLRLTNCHYFFNHDFLKHVGEGILPFWWNFETKVYLQRRWQTVQWFGNGWPLGGEIEHSLVPTFEWKRQFYFILNGWVGWCNIHATYLLTSRSRIKDHNDQYIHQSAYPFHRRLSN